MGNRFFQLQKNEFYHIYNRGCNKQQLFFEEKDFERFLINIARFSEKYKNIVITSWALLPNHFHLILREKSLSDNPRRSINISRFMKSVQQSYAMFFNVKYGEKVKQGKKAPIFEGRFKAKLVQDGEYLEALKNYIEQNAVKHEIVKKPEEWNWSSFDKEAPGKDFDFDDFDVGFE